MDRYEDSDRGITKHNKTTFKSKKLPKLKKEPLTNGSIAVGVCVKNYILTMYEI